MLAHSLSSGAARISSSYNVVANSVRWPPTMAENQNRAVAAAPNKPWARVTAKAARSQNSKRNEKQTRNRHHQIKAEDNSREALCAALRSGKTPHAILPGGQS